MVDVVGTISEYANFRNIMIIAGILTFVTFLMNAGAFALSSSTVNLVMIIFGGGSTLFWFVMVRNSRNVVFRDAVAGEPMAEKALNAQLDGQRRITMFENELIAWQWENEPKIVHAAQVIEVKLSKMTAHDMNEVELARMTRDYESIMNTGDVEIVTVHARKKIGAKDWVSRLERKRDNLTFDAELGGRATYGEKALEATSTLQRVKTGMENVYDSRFYFIVSVASTSLDRARQDLKANVNSIIERLRDQLKLEVGIMKGSKLEAAASFFRVYSALGSAGSDQYIGQLKSFRSLSFDVGWQNPFAVPRLPPLSKLMHGIYIGRVLTTGQPVHWDPNDTEMGSPHALAIGPTGCLGRGQKILMHDGTIRNVEDVGVGELLMGPDSEPRKILELRHGRDAMFKIKPIKGKPFAVNGDHVITLVRTNTTLNSQLNGKTIDVSVKDWRQWSKTQKHLYKLFRVGVKFPASTSPLPIDPYFMGVLLGDGGFVDVISVTTADSEIAKTVFQQAKLFGLHVSVYSGSSGKAKIYKMAGKKGGDISVRRNDLRDRLRELKLGGVVCETKFIPQNYKVSSREDRLQLLAGLIDTDGSLGGGIYDFSSKSSRLAKDTAFLARSLGFNATESLAWKKDQDGKSGWYHRIWLSGDLSQVPARLSKKKAKPRRQKKNHLRTGFGIKPLGEGEYFGFVLDGDGRHVLEDFTVTHNSGKTTMGRTFLYRALESGIPYWVIDPAGDYTEFTKKLGGVVIDFENETMNPFVLYDRNPINVAKVVVDMVTLISGLQGAERFFMQERIIEAYREAGVNESDHASWTDDASNKVNFKSLYKETELKLRANKFSATDAMLARGVLQKIQDLSSGVFALGEQNINLDELFKAKKPVCFYVREALGESLRKALAWTLIMQLRALAFTRYKISEELRLFLMVDEAHHFVKAMVGQGVPGGRIDTPLVAFIREMRKKGVACWLLSQAPEDFLNPGERTSPIFINVGTTLMLGKADQAYMEFVTRYMGLTDEDAWGPNGLYWMTRHGQGVLKKSNDPRPIPIQIEAEQAGMTSKEEIDEVPEVAKAKAEENG